MALRNNNASVDRILKMEEGFCFISISGALLGNVLGIYPLLRKVKQYSKTSN